MNKVIPIAILATAVALFLFYTEPKWNDLTGNSDNSAKSVRELLDLKGQYASALDKVKEVETLRTGLLAKYNSLSQGDKDALGKLLPDTIDEPRFVNDVNTVAAEYGMSLGNISYSETKSSGTGNAPGMGSGAPPPQTVPGSPSSGTPAAAAPAKYSPVELSFAVSGSYENFIGFLTQLERSLRLLDVTSVALGAGKSASQGAPSSSSPAGAGNNGKNQSGGKTPSNPDFFTFSVTMNAYHLK